MASSKWIWVPIVEREVTSMKWFSFHHSTLWFNMVDLMNGQYGHAPCVLEMGANNIIKGANHCMAAFTKTSHLPVPPWTSAPRTPWVPLHFAIFSRTRLMRKLIPSHHSSSSSSRSAVASSLAAALVASSLVAALVASVFPPASLSARVRRDHLPCIRVVSNLLALVVPLCSFACRRQQGLAFGVLAKETVSCADCPLLQAGTIQDVIQHSDLFCFSIPKLNIVWVVKSLCRKVLGRQWPSQRCFDNLVHRI